MTDYVSAYGGTGLYANEAQRLTVQLSTEATITDRVIRWNSNGSVPPADCVALAAHIGLPIDVAACTAARDTEVSAFLAAYRKNPPRDTAEARFERRAAFGPGATVVNVITGQKYRT